MDTIVTKAPAHAGFELAPLPYAEDALEPVISKRTLALHYGKHHRGYVEKLNKAVENTDLAHLALDEVVRRSARDTSLQGVFNNAGQAWNHHFYWRSLSPKGGRPDGELLKRIERDLGGYERFAEAMTKAATGQFGSGWAWLVLDKGKLRIIATANADTPIVRDGQTPLLTLDVWEHAYYLDYQNRREEHVKKVIDKLLNWGFAAENAARG
jgi:Fe-Mn family superoxide dismutase